MTNVLASVAKQKFFTNNGAPAAGYKLFTYAAGTTTKLATYQGPTTGSPNASPVVLNFRGECDLWVPPNVAYKFVFTTPTDTDPPSNPIWTVDNIVDSQLVTLYGGVDTGSANAYVLNFVANFTGYADGIVIYWLPANTNTGATTVNVNGLGPVNILNQDGTALVRGQIQANVFQTIIYQGVGFKLITPAQQVFFAGASGGIVNSYTLTVANFAFRAGNVLYWAPNITNTGDVTLTVNGTAVNVRNVDGTVLAASQIQAGKTVGVIVNNSGTFTLISTVSTPLLTVASSWAPAWSGFSVNPVGNLSYFKVGNIVFLYTTAGLIGTSNGTGMDISNTPLEIMPAGLVAPCFIQDNGVLAAGMVGRTGLSTLIFSKGTAPPSTTGFTAAGAKGLPAGFTAVWAT